VGTCAEADTGYALKLEVYEGKARDPARASARHLNGLGFNVVSALIEDYQLKNHIVYYDRFFSSVALAEFLLQRQTYVNSTVMLNRKGLPQAAKKLKLKKGQPCKQLLKGNVLVNVLYEKGQIANL